MTKVKTALGFLLLLITTTALFIELPSEVKMRVDNDKTTFYVYDGKYWRVGGREYNKLYDGNSLMNRRISSIFLEDIFRNETGIFITRDGIYVNDTRLFEDEIKTIQINQTFMGRYTKYIRSPVTIDKYSYDGNIDDIEMIPISHTIEVFNGTGFYYRYEVKDLTYDGDSFKLDGKQTSMSFGKNMKVEWWEDYRLGWIYKQGTMYVKSEKIDSDYVEFDVRLFDPWDYMVMITFDNSLQDENLINFPVLIVLNSTSIDYAHFKSDGTDIRFNDSDNVTELDYEIELWNTSGNSYIWVEVPQINASSSTDHIWMHYGNAVASDGQNVEGTWNGSYFITVYHLDKYNSSNYVKDFTGNTDGCSVEGGATNVSALIVSGYKFVDDATDDDILSCGNDGVFATNDNFTYEAWIKTELSDCTGLTQAVMAKTWAYTTGVWIFRLDGENARFRIKTAGGDKGPTGTDDVCDQQWHYIVAVRDGDNLNVYTDSGDKVTATGVSGTNIYNLYNTTIGRVGDDIGVPAFYAFNGTIDEVRMSNVSRSESWINATYQNINSPFEFVTFGSEEQEGVTEISLTLTQPTNTTYPSTTIWINGTTNINGNITWSMNGEANQTACNICTTFSNSTSDNVIEGSNNITIYVINSTNSTDIDTKIIYFTISPLTILIDNPINGTTYQETSRLWLNVTNTSGDVDQWWYNLDCQDWNVTFTPNTTITVGRGFTNITVYANDTNGDIYSNYSYIAYNGTRLFRMVQITDTHEDSTDWVNNRANMKLAIDWALGSNPLPNFIVHTGDWTDKVAWNGTSFDAVVSEMERFGVTWFVVPGNHDENEAAWNATLESYGKDDYNDYPNIYPRNITLPPVITFDNASWQIVLLNSEEGEVHHILDTQLDWFNSTFAGDTTSHFIIMYHSDDNVECDNCGGGSACNTSCHASWNSYGNGGYILWGHNHWTPGAVYEEEGNAYCMGSPTAETNYNPRYSLIDIYCNNTWSYKVFKNDSLTEPDISQTFGSYEPCPDFYGFEEVTVTNLYLNGTEENKYYEYGDGINITGTVDSGYVCLSVDLPEYGDNYTCGYKSVSSIFNIYASENKFNDSSSSKKINDTSGFEGTVYYYIEDETADAVDGRLDGYGWTQLTNMHDDDWSTYETCKSSYTAHYEESYILPASASSISEVNISFKVNNQKDHDYTYIWNYDELNWDLVNTTNADLYGIITISRNYTMNSSYVKDSEPFMWRYVTDGGGGYTSFFESMIVFNTTLNKKQIYIKLDNKSVIVDEAHINISGTEEDGNYPNNVVLDIGDNLIYDTSLLGNLIGNNLIVNELSDGSTAENVSFTDEGGGTDVIYVTLPSRTNVTYAHLNISGFTEEGWDDTLWNATLTTSDLYHSSRGYTGSIGDCFEYTCTPSEVYLNKTFTGKLTWADDNECSRWINITDYNNDDYYIKSIYTMSRGCGRTVYEGGAGGGNSGWYILRYATDISSSGTCNTTGSYTSDSGSTIMKTDEGSETFCSSIGAQRGYVNLTRTDTTMYGSNLDSSKKSYIMIVVTTDSPYSSEPSLAHAWCNNTWDANSYVILEMYNITDIYPENPYINIGGDSDVEWSLTGPLTSSNITDDLADEINEYLWSSDCTEDTCDVPIYVYSDSVGKIEISGINVSYNPNPISLNVTRINELLDDSETINISIGSSEWGAITFSGINISYNGSQNITVKAHNLTLENNDTQYAYVVFSDYNFTRPYSFLNELIFRPNTNESMNVTPFGQTSTTPSHNITSLAYDQPFNYYIYMNETVDCVNITVSNTSSKDDGVPLNTTIIAILQNCQPMQQCGGVWFWADYACPTTTNVYTRKFERYTKCTECI